MCLILKEGESIRIAKRNILVRKWVIPIKSSNPPQWTPVLIDGTGAYEFNNIIVARSFDNESKLVEIERLKEYKNTIDVGFHSYSLFARFTLFSKIFARFTLFSKKTATEYYAVIPKGSEYAKGCVGDIVSNRIIVFSNLWKYLIWEIQTGMILK